MIRNLLKYKLVAVCLFSLIMFLPALFGFYTNDDFFFLKISNIHSIGEFFNFFNILSGPDGFGVYRPLSTQVFYFLGWFLFDLNPLPLRIIAFLTLFGIIYLIYKLVEDLTANTNIAFFAALLYATSATHFGHVYYLATFQELLMTFFVLLSTLSFLRKKFMKSFLFFVLALMSKETAIITPFLYLVIYLNQKLRLHKMPNIIKFIKNLWPYYLTIAVYMILRYYFYGFATGDSYIWDFSVKKLINTILWYIVWSLNMPESLVDFVGPGLKLNPNLLLYWKAEIVPIFTLFALLAIQLSWMLVKALIVKSPQKTDEINRISTVSILWFVVSLVPVIFLPYHKFTFYLTLPLIGVVLRLAYLLEKTGIKNFLKISFVATWIALSFLTLGYTSKTNWITNSEKISRNVFEYFEKNQKVYEGQKFVFRDTPDDAELPWSPTQTVKVALSDRNFFYVFFPKLSDYVSYGEGEGTVVTSRQFLGY